MHRVREIKNDKVRESAYKGYKTIPKKSSTFILKQSYIRVNNFCLTLILTYVYICIQILFVVMYIYVYHHCSVHNLRYIDI